MSTISSWASDEKNLNPSGSTIYDLVCAHFEQRYSELTLAGTTYEMYAESREGYVVFGVDSLLKSRYVLGHDLTFEEACAVIAKEVEEQVLQYLAKEKANEA